VPGGIHHSVVVVRDLEASLRFYRDGIGLDLLLDRHVEGGVPCVAGTRIPVATIVGLVANGLTTDEIVAEYPQLCRGRAGA
jgi:catechol 2,3-dioxygenase-like lactoylglutathione lyase family enzyme